MYTVKTKVTFGGKLSVLIILLALVQILSATITENETAPEQEIGIIEHLGEYVPLDLYFIDSNGDSVLLKDYVDKPTVVSLVYYNCPGICSPLLGGVVDVLDRMPLEPGKDYKVLTISFNPHETPAMGNAKKKNYFKAFQRREFPPQYWKWMTGDSLSIKKITDAFGFKYKKVGTEYVHAGALMVISPEGKISRYLRGIEFQPFDLKMAILEASEGRVGPTISKVLLYCFSYDPKGKQYTLNVMKIGGTIFLVMLVAFVAVLTIKSKTRSQKER
ncbi:MAG: SCO family protein [Calditrichia bacterium]